MGVPDVPEDDDPRPDSVHFLARDGRVCGGRAHGNRGELRRRRGAWHREGPRLVGRCDHPRGAVTSQDLV